MYVFFIYTKWWNKATKNNTACRIVECYGYRILIFAGDVSSALLFQCRFPSIYAPWNCHSAYQIKSH